LLNDLLVQSDEYEKTKLQLLNLPFIQQIINEMADKQIHEKQFMNQEQPNIKIEKCNFFEPCDLTDDIKDLFFETDPYNLYDAERERIYYEKENISLNIEDPIRSHEFDISNILNINVEGDSDVEEEEEEEEEDDESVDEEVVVVDETGPENESVDEEEVVVDELGEDQEEIEESVNEELHEDEELVEEEVVDESSEEQQDDAEEEVLDESSEEEENADELEEDEEGVFEIEINGTTYFTDNEKNGTIYSVDVNGDPDEEIGRFINGAPIFSNKQ
jgi:hypothetical protein